MELTAAARSTDMLLRYGIVDLAPGIRDTEWTGRGTDLEAGLDLDVPISGGFFLEAGGRYGVLLETEVTRSPGLSASGGQISEDRGDLKRTTGSVRAALGHEWGGRAAVWVGAAAAWDQVRLKGSAAAEFQQPSGLFEQRRLRRLVRRVDVRRRPGRGPATPVKKDAMETPRRGDGRAARGAGPRQRCWRWPA